jgi:hypothetical protein
MRPGRLDRLIYVGPPDAQGREEIFRIRTKSMSIAPNVDILVLVALVSALHNPKTEFLILIKKLSLRQKDAPAQKSWPFVRRQPCLPCRRISTHHMYVHLNGIQLVVN